jgi:uncharacterized protein YjbI with pentapeptide repeats
MANNQHLEILAQGVTPWNDWRARSPRIIPDLSGANLANIHLPGVNLIKADLTEANLHAANLANVKLTGATLRRANLTEAVLARANLTEADLTEGSLQGKSHQSQPECSHPLWGKPHRCES